MNLDMDSVGQRIKHKRKELGLTQTDIYNRYGIGSGALSQIENGTRTPSVTIFYKLSQALECNMEWLLTGFSTNSEIGDFSILKDNRESLLLKNFRELPAYDQEEIFDLINIKIKRAKGGNTSVKSSNSTNTESGSMVV